MLSVRMTMPRLVLTVVLTLLAGPLGLEAQQTRVYRVGIVMQGGPYNAAIDGLRDGLKELGLEEGKQLVLQVRDTRGDLKSVEAAARSLEGEKVDLIYAVSTSVTLGTKRATKTVPIVFYAGADPVAAGLVQSFRKPGGRLTGIYGVTDIIPKRLELLKEMIPSLRRVVTFYSPGNPVAQRSMKMAREAARQLKVELVERPVGSVEELRAGLRALRPGDADAMFYVSDAMVTSQNDAVIEIATAKRLPTMLQEHGAVEKGALASYGGSFYAFGRFSAKHVHRVLLGADPAELPVEQLDRLHLAINLKTAKAIGLTIPPTVLARADELIE
jgi:putative tryptophan/tyrosine transport system substrate-binding protein